MFKYIILCLSVCLCVSCAPNKEEGATCEWEGLKGTCVSEKRCMTTLDNRNPKQPACPHQGGKDLICCTDCELIENTDDIVIMPDGGFYIKDGRKARDNCLHYIKDLQYKCHEDVYGGLTRTLNKEKKCHGFSFYAVGGAPAVSLTGSKEEPRAEYPHQALLGFGDTKETATWLAGGSIISDRYVLTAAHVLKSGSKVPDNVNFVAVGVKSFSDKSNWQILKIKRVVPHPNYIYPSKHNDIGLVETETLIEFGPDVLPACLHVDDTIDTSQAIATTWRDLTSSDEGYADSIQTIRDLEQNSEKECSETYPKSRQLMDGFDNETQVCYASKKHSNESCKGLSGEPLLVRNQFSNCVYTVVGVTSSGYRCASQDVKPEIYTRVAHYVSWIESVVWP